MNNEGEKALFSLALSPACLPTFDQSLHRTAAYLLLSPEGLLLTKERAQKRYHYAFTSTDKGVHAMATVQPFRAIRYTAQAGDIQMLVCPPYDIIPLEAQKEYLAKSNYNIIRLEKPTAELAGTGTDLPIPQNSAPHQAESTAQNQEDPYQAAGALFQEWLEAGILAQDELPALFVYQMEWQGKTLEGVVARVLLEEFSKGVILPHEETLSKAKQDRFNLMCAAGCNFSDIYAIYDEPKVKAPSVKGAPLYEVTDENLVVHRLWALTDPQAIESYTQGLADTRLYIADGHHRYETALRYRNQQRNLGAPLGSDSDYLMMLLVEMSHPGLEVLPTHRVVQGLEHCDAQALLDAAAPYFAIERTTPDQMQSALEAAYQQGKKAFGLYAKGTAALLTFQGSCVPEALLPNATEASRKLDVQILHVLVLEHILGIDRANMAEQKNLVYLRDWGKAKAAVDANNADLAFMLNPPRVSEIRDVAAAGEKMPQKSTYFYPKVVTGLTLNPVRGALGGA
jgi:uncharacterized protein (DUF1015 family)